jgi:hypothetical protein
MTKASRPSTDGEHLGHAAATRIESEQAAWVVAHGATLATNGRSTCLDDNLFRPLSPETRREFDDAPGGELAEEGGLPPKMSAARSSSALAANVFEYWRQSQDRSPLARALGLTGDVTAVEFERPFTMEMRGHRPNLDVVLTSESPRLAIESKFLEPFDAHSAHTWADSYFPQGRRRWAEWGLTGCQRLAEQMREGVVVYRLLHAEQLLKHALGLAHTGEPFGLLYLWYDVGGPAAERHAEEIDDFAGYVSGDPIGFRTLTYQQLFGELSATCREQDRPYLEYLGSRYFHGFEHSTFKRWGIRPDWFMWHPGEITILPPESGAPRG